MRLTVDRIMDAGPCEDWPRHHVQAIFGKRKWMRLGTLLRDSRVPVVDRLWVACRVGCLTNEQLTSWASDCKWHVTGSGTLDSCVVDGVRAHNVSVVACTCAGKVAAAHSKRRGAYAIHSAFIDAVDKEARWQLDRLLTHHI